MTDRPPIPDLVRTSKVIAIGRNVPPGDAPRVGEAFVAGGVHVMELTLNEPEGDALRAIEALAAVADDLGALVGAGTVLSIGAAKRAVDAGARFIVSPHTDTELIAWCALSSVPCFPGALSPTEIHAAWAATGGVSASTAGDWIAAGAVAVGMGGWLIGDGEPAGITERSREVVAAVSR